MKKVLRFIAYSQAYVDNKWKRGNPIFAFIIVVSAVFAIFIELLFRISNVWKSDNIFIELYIFILVIGFSFYLSFGDKLLDSYINEYNSKKSDITFVKKQRKKSWYFIFLCLLIMAVLGKINFHLRNPLATW